MGSFYSYNYNIRLICKSEEDKPFSTSGESVKELLSDTGLFSKEPVCICADPFLFVREGKLHLFYEFQRRHYGKGEIHMTSTSDLTHWTPDTKVLEEPFHLSFPNVFEDGGNTFMLPETGGDGSIRLYTSSDLVHWSPYRTIVKDGRPWADSDIVKHDGHYYLFTSIYSRKSIEMHILVSDSLDGEFIEHPMSPITADPARARNAGSIFRHDGRLYRPVQDCSKGYGKDMSIMEICELTPVNYCEKVAALKILDRTDGFYRYGGHQFNPVSFKGLDLVATDAKVRNYNLVELGRRLVKHAKGK